MTDEPFSPTMNPELPLEGTVRESEFLPGLVRMGRERFTGALRFERGEVVKIVYLRDGGIFSASTNEPSESLDEILLRGGKITRDHVHQARDRRKSEESMGEALLHAGFISRKELRWAKRHQVVRVLRSVLTDGRWHYTIVPDYISTRDLESVAFPAEQILLELVVTEESRERVDRTLEGGRVVLEKARNFLDRYKGLDLNQDADEVIAFVDGERTAMEAAEAAGSDRLMNLRLLTALSVLGLLQRPEQPKGILDVSTAAAEIPSARNALLPGVAAAGARVPQPQGAWRDGDDDAKAPSAPDGATEADPRGPAPSGTRAAEREWIEPPRAIEPQDPVASDPELRDEAPPGEWEVEATGSSEAVEEMLATVEHDDVEGRRTPRWLVPLLAIAILALILLLGWWLLGRWGMEEPGREPSGAPAEIGDGSLSAETAEPARAGTARGDEGVPGEGTAGRTPAEDSGRVGEAAAEGVDTLRARYDRMAEEFLREAASVPYTVQFVLLCETTSITQARDLGGADVWFVPVEFRGRSCFRVFWGRFQSEEGALAAIPGIPERLRESRPVVIRPGEALR
jgi:hypothetical protein